MAAPPSNPNCRQARLLRIVLGAIAGGIAFSLLVLYFEGYRWIPRTAESGGLVQNLFYLALLTFERMFLTTWGPLGALVGAGIGWLTTFTRRDLA